MRRCVTGLLIPILVSTAGAQGSLTGYVRDEATLRGLQGAEVGVAGTDHKTKTDRDGKYTLKDILPGTQRISVRAVGYAPADTALVFSADKSTENVFFLGKPAVALDTVKTRSQARTQGAGFASFEDRRAKGFGAFLDSAFLRANESRHLPDLLLTLKGVQVLQPTTCHLTRPVLCDWRVAATKRGTRTICTMQVVLDGSVLQRSLQFEDLYAPPNSPEALVRTFEDKMEDLWRQTFDLNTISVSSLIGVEVYRSGAEAPDVYGGASTNCGVLVLWSHG
jgi:hypothetical protein